MSGSIREFTGRVWGCDACGFEFDAAHADGDNTTCPVCEVAEMQLFDLRYTADQRAIARWRAVYRRLSAIW